MYQKNVVEFDDRDGERITGNDLSASRDALCLNHTGAHGGRRSVGKGIGLITERHYWSTALSNVGVLRCDVPGLVVAVWWPLRIWSIVSCCLPLFLGIDVVLLTTLSGLLLARSNLVVYTLVGSIVGTVRRVVVGVCRFLVQVGKHAHAEVFMYL